MKAHKDTAAFERYRQEHARCLGMAVGEFRTNKSLTLSEVAKRANVPVLWVQRLEANQLHTNYTIRRLDQVARALGVELYDLYKRVGEMMRPPTLADTGGMNKPKRAGKRIRRLSLEEPYPKSQEVYLTIEFDDETEILIEVECRLRFGIKHLVRGADGDLEPVKESMHGAIRSLAKGRR